MYNRFGFSSKKADRPFSNQFNSVQPNRISSTGNNGVKNNPEITPSIGAKMNNPFSFGKDPALGKLSTGKQLKFTSNSAIPSTGKLLNRISGQRFSSARKNSLNSNLFTPQHARSSFLPQNGTSTSRLSRSSMSSRGGKDVRPLSDQAFHRECQEKIYDFLTVSSFPHQLNKKDLLRPNLSDVSRIFEFLFSFFQPGISIKNGPNTSIEVVVPKMLTELGYPYQLKRSDLVSFSGGRQLGAIFESICFVIDNISYLENSDISQFTKQFVSDEFTDSVTTQLSEINLKNMNHNEEEAFQNAEEELWTLANVFFGTKEQIEQHENELKKLEENLERVETESATHLGLPHKLQTLIEDLDKNDKYLVETNSKVNEHKEILNELRDELDCKKQILEKVFESELLLNSQVDSQKEIIMQYRLSIEKKNQVDEEIKKISQKISDLDEQILSSTLDVSKQKQQNTSYINDIDDVIISFFTSINSSRIKQISPDFSKTFENDKAWKDIYVQFLSFKDWEIENANDELIREILNFGQKFHNKFKDFKHKLLQLLSCLEGSASIELICKKQELQTVLEQNRHLFSESEEKLKLFQSEKISLEKEESNKLNEFLIEIDSLTKTILEIEKDNTTTKDKISKNSSECTNLQSALKKKQFQFMKLCKERIGHDYQVLKSVNEEQKENIQNNNRNTFKEEKLKMLQEYKKKLTITS